MHNSLEFTVFPRTFVLRNLWTMIINANTLRAMNAMIQHRPEVDVGTIEATEAKIDALRDSLDETKKDVRELRVEINSLRDKVDRIHGEMHAGFAALHQSIAGVQASVAELRATMKTMVWAVSVVGMLAMIFFTAGKALHWF